NGGGTAKTLAGNASVNGNLLINSNATFDGGSYAVTAQGHWTNNGTFTASSSLVTLAGTGKNLSGATTFKNLTVSGSYTGINDIVVVGAMINSGTYTAGGTTITIAGDFSGSGSLTSSGTITFSGTNAQSIALNSGFSSTGTVNFNGTVSPALAGAMVSGLQNVNINNTGGITPASDWTINGAFV